MEKQERKKGVTLLQRGRREKLPNSTGVTKPLVSCSVAVASDCRRHRRTVPAEPPPCREIEVENE
ncbi:uncharacterized protein DS421_3g78670 [Arachis hypogaea]|nr:uncharacterized protein DS421_3g78670 [Arachis hypogaea]